MRRIRTTAFVFAAIASLSSPASGNADLLDVIARIDYGFYSGDVNVISAATSELDRLRGDDAARSYYRAYAAWRSNQADSYGSQRVRRDRTADCLDFTASLFDDPEWAVEAYILAAACALWAEQQGGARSSVYRSKASAAIDAARALDPKHPRLLLVMAMADRRDESSGHSKSQLEMLATALGRLEPRSLAADLRPAWGRPELLASMAAIELDRGNTREARDLIERALLEAPGFRFALHLKKALSLR